MSEAKHTPGPWFVFECDGICTVMPAGRPGEIADNIANGYDASLIAAAPNLLEYVESSASAGCATAQALIDRLLPTSDHAEPK